MTKMRLLCCLAGFTVLTLACSSLSGAATGEALPASKEPAAATLEPPTPTVTPTEVIPEVPAACAARLGELVAESEDGGGYDEGGYYEDDGYYDGGEGNYDEETDETVLVTYPVNGDELGKPVFSEEVPAGYVDFQKDTNTQKELWDFVVDVIPVERRRMVGEFIIFSDGVDNVMGAVDQLDDPAKWTLEMDIADAQDFPVMSTTLVHEYGHLLTLNNEQFITDMDVFNNPDDDTVWDQANAACDTYFSDEGCSTDNAYLYTFFERFWPNIYDEWVAIDDIADENEYQDALDKFYAKYSDQFVTDYAVTDPSEDIADSWMYFVFNPKPTGDSIAEQKILFFYEYPELVRLRDQIRAGLCPYLGE